MSDSSVDVTGMVSSITDQVATGVTDNEGRIAVVAGGLLALTVVWRLVRKFLAVRSDDPGWYKGDL